MERVSFAHPHQVWSMDFVSDALYDGRKFRALTVVDNFSRKCLAIYAAKSFKGEHVVEIMSRIHTWTGRKPERIQVDNGSEFAGKALDKWAYDNDVTLDFSRPGTPTDNPYMSPSTEAFGTNA